MGIYFSKGEFENAISAFKKSIEVNPENFLAHNNLGLSYKNIRNFDAALKSHKMLLKNKDCRWTCKLWNSINVRKFQEGFREYEWRKK